MSNAGKWGAVLAIGALCGLTEALFDTEVSLKLCLRHALMGMMPGIVGLKTTLEREVGIVESAKAAASGK